MVREAGAMKFKGNINISKTTPQQTLTDANARTTVKKRTEASNVTTETVDVYTPGAAGYAVVMAVGANNWINTPAFILSNANNAVRVRGWFNITGTSVAAQYIYMLPLPISSSVFLLSIPAGTSNISFFWWDTLGGNHSVSWANALVGKFGAKRQIGLDVDYAAKTATLYMDGISLGVKDISAGGTPQFPSGNHAKGFGCDGYSSATAQLIGIIDEVAIWNTIGGDAWWLADYNGGAGTHTLNSADLEVGYHLNEGAGSGAILIDISGNARTGNLGAANTWTAGLVNIPGAYNATEVDRTEDGVAALESVIRTIGHANGAMKILGTIKADATFNGTAMIKGSRIITRTSIPADLSGAATALVCLHTERACTLRKATLLYSEASSADAGITITIGKESDADYYYTGTSEINKALWYSLDVVLLATDIAAGDTVIFSSVGGKADTGEIILVIEYTVN